MRLSSDLTSALDLVAECEQAARAAGVVHAAAHLRACRADLKLALRAVRRSGGEPSGPVEPDGVTELLLEDGRRTGWAHRPVGSGIAERTSLAGCTLARLPMVAAHDLGWDLVQSASARSFAIDDLQAALLQDALTAVGWVSTGRASRWVTSATGAATLVRLLRSGRAAPTLAGAADRLLDVAVVDFLDGLGWRPERREQLGK